MTGLDRERLIEVLLAARTAIVCDLNGQLAIRLIDDALAALPAEPERERHLDWRDEIDQQERADVIASVTEPVRATDPVRAEDLQVDVFSRGAGANYEALVRITHRPTGVIGAATANSQLQAREAAMKALRTALAADREPEPVQITDEMKRRAAEAVSNQLERGYRTHWCEEWQGQRGCQQCQEIAAHALAAALSEPPPEGEQP